MAKNPGTTRDLIESYVDIDGLPIRFYDTAGIRKSGELVEKMGIKKSRELAEKSDLNLIFIEKYDEIKKYKSLGKNIYVQSKFDIRKKPLKKQNIINISSKTSYGLKKLTNKIKKNVSNISFNESRILSRERHIFIMKDVLKTLDSIDFSEIVISTERHNFFSFSLIEHRSLEIDSGIIGTTKFGK